MFWFANKKLIGYMSLRPFNYFCFWFCSLFSGLRLLMGMDKPLDKVSWKFGSNCYWCEWHWLWYEKNKGLFLLLFRLKVQVTPLSLGQLLFCSLNFLFFISISYFQVCNHYKFGPYVRCCLRLCHYASYCSWVLRLGKENLYIITLMFGD